MPLQAAQVCSLIFGVIGTFQAVLIGDRISWRIALRSSVSTAGGQNSTSPLSPRHLYESTSHIGLSDVSAIAFGGVDQLSSICGQNARPDGLMYGSISAFA